jgi:hypothetical protein
MQLASRGVGSTEVNRSPLTSSTPMAQDPPSAGSIELASVSMRARHCVQK